jgi:hypothetical protein
LQAGSLAHHPIDLGFLDPIIQVGDDLDQPWSLPRVDPEARAADAGLTEMILDQVRVRLEAAW